MSKDDFRRRKERLQQILYQLRREAGLSQIELAKRLGKPQSYVSKYELGERRLDLLELSQICEAVGISLEELVRRFEDC